jgi:hypothetical protein
MEKFIELRKRFDVVVPTSGSGKNTIQYQSKSIEEQQIVKKSTASKNSIFLSKKTPPVLRNFNSFICLMPVKPLILPP